MKKTAYYHLPLYEDNDPFDPRDGYNQAMRILDQKLNQLNITIRTKVNTTDKEQ